MDEQKIKEFIQIVIDQIKSDKDNLDIAIDIANDFLNQNPIPAEMLLGLVPHFGSDNFYEAAYVLSKVAASVLIGETQASAHFNAGLASQVIGYIEEAEEQYKAALAADPKDENTHYNYGLLLQESGRIKEAEEQYKAVLAANPNHVKTHSNYGILLKQSGHKEEAEKQYKAALAADPKDVNTHYNYGVLLKQNGHIEEAEEQYKAALVADPSHVDTHNNYGLLLQESGRIKEAEEQYKIALEIDPKYVNTHYNYGLLLYQSGRIEKAEEQFKVVLAADYNHVSTHNTYGLLLHQSGRIEDAEEKYKVALAANPNHVNTHINYGLLLQESGRIEEAEEQYKTALAADPEHANAHGAYSFLLFSRNENKKALEETKIASQLFDKKEDKVMKHLAFAWLFEGYTEKFYEKGCLRNAKKKKSKGNFNKSGRYAGLAGEKYIKASEYEEEKARKLYLTQGYTLMGRSEVRRLELSFLESIQFRIKHFQNYDIDKFERIMDGVKNASNYYRKAADHSPERNPQCDACAKCMTTLGSVLDIMLLVIHQKGVSDTVLEEKINYWNEQLSFAEMVYKVQEKSEKGEHFVTSLRKLIDCIDNLVKFQKSTMHEYKKALKDCMTELIEVAENIEGPLHEIIVDSTKRMEKCALKQGLYTGGIYDKSIEDQSFFKRILRWIINHPIKSGIGFILAILASYIANNLDKILIF